MHTVTLELQIPEQGHTHSALAILCAFQPRLTAAAAAEFILEEFFAESIDDGEMLQNTAANAVAHADRTERANEKERKSEATPRTVALRVTAAPKQTPDTIRRIVVTTTAEGAARAEKSIDYRAQVLEAAKNELASWRMRYAALEQFAKVFEVVDELDL